MAVLCAWASANEYGKTTGGKAGEIGRAHV